MLLDYCLTALVVVVASVCVVTDVARRKIFNWVTLPGILLGIVLHTAVHGWSGMGSSLVGLAVGFGFSFLLFLVGAVRGGDVKLSGAMGACLGWPLVVWVIILTHAAGLVLALGAMVWMGEVRLRLWRIWRLLHSLVLAALYPVTVVENPTTETGTPIPFGVAIFFGTLGTLVARSHLLAIFPG